jgi:hypothetical protein
VLRWPLEQRRAYLLAVERQRGKAACDRLRAELRVQHAAREQARQQNIKQRGGE